jgi:hypothetical protein
LIRSPGIFATSGITAPPWRPRPAPDGFTLLMAANNSMSGTRFSSDGLAPEIRDILARHFSHDPPPRPPA